MKRVYFREANLGKIFSLPVFYIVTLPLIIVSLMRN